jgi:beta-glucosidase-like glycosyl hydrolase
MGDALLKAVTSGDIAESVVDDSVKRILTMMYANGLFDHYEQWTNNSRAAHGSDVTSTAHSRIARGTPQLFVCCLSLSNADSSLAMQTLLLQAQCY